MINLNKHFGIDKCCPGNEIKSKLLGQGIEKDINSKNYCQYCGKQIKTPQDKLKHKKHGGK